MIKEYILNKHMIKDNIWRILFYVSMGTLTLWLILKVTGVINTPVWLEFGVPVASLVLGLLSFYRDLMKNMAGLAVGLATLATRFEHLDKKVEHLGGDMSSVKTSIGQLDKKVTHLDFDLEFVKKRVA